MQHTDQHIEAIKPTVRVLNEVTASVFDDKVKPCGLVKVSRGVITISMESIPSMVSDEATMAFTLDAIRLSLEECWRRRPTAFDPFSE